MFKHTKITFNHLFFVAIISILFIFSCCCVMDSYNFFKHISNTIYSVSSKDIIIYILCGIVSTGKTGLLDIMRFSIPYILILFITNIYISNMLDNNLNYFSIIRYKNYNTWMKKILLRLILIVVSYFSLYYLFTIIITIFSVGQLRDFSNTFNFLYPSYNHNITFFNMLLLQYILSISIEIILVLFQLILGLFKIDYGKSFTFLSLTIISLSLMGKYDFFNVLMLSKHYTLNMNLKIKALNTIIIYIIIIIGMSLSLNKLSELSRRRI